MSFDSPFLLLLAPVFGACVAVVALLARGRRLARAAAWSEALALRARTGGRTGPFLLGLAALAAGVGLAGPRGGRTTVKAEVQALSVVFAMDISRSMLAEDSRPNRLHRAAREARRLVLDLRQDRLGLIAFAGRSYILSPLTLDGGAITLFLDALSPYLASQGGTGLASALAQGAGVLNASREAGDRVLVVFTDGETHDSLSEVLAQARLLREQQIRLVLVAQGGARGVPIPVRDSSGTIIEYQADEAGRAIETRRRDDVLQQVADAAEGALVPAELPDQAGAVRDLLAAFQRAPLTGSSTQDLLPLVWIAALLAAVCLSLQTVTRRSAALVALGGLVLGLTGPLAAQRPAPGTRDFEAGRAREAARLLGARVGPNASDTTWYNAGTAMLEAGEYAAARQNLSRAARSLDPELRYRALYNHGVAALRQAQADSAARDSLLAEAAGRFKDALTLVPASARAKWNLELAQRRLPPPPSGGGQRPPPPAGGNQPPDPDPGQSVPQDRQDLSQAQAEQILNSVEREERDTRTRRLGKSRAAVRGEKDW